MFDDAGTKGNSPVHQPQSMDGPIEYPEQPSCSVQTRGTAFTHRSTSPGLEPEA